MRSERGSALIEAVAAFPACIACALVIVDCGVLVRDRIATTQAATRAAAAELAGTDARAAARAALPMSLRASLRLHVTDAGVDVRVTSRPAVLPMPAIVQHSHANLAVSGGVR
jgi:hypothetical protein